MLKIESVFRCTRETLIQIALCFVLRPISLGVSELFKFKIRKNTFKFEDELSYFDSWRRRPLSFLL